MPTPIFSSQPRIKIFGLLPAFGFLIAFTGIFLFYPPPEKISADWHGICPDLPVASDFDNFLGRGYMPPSPGLPGPPPIVSPPATGWCSVGALAPYFGANAESAAIICQFESGGDPGRVDPAGCGQGLFQIDICANPHYAGLNLLDPIVNIQIAHSMSGGGSWWGSWSVAYSWGCDGTSLVTNFTGLIDSCVPWWECGSHGVSGGFNCWECVSRTCP